MHIATLGKKIIDVLFISIPIQVSQCKKVLYMTVHENSAYEDM